MINSMSAHEARDNPHDPRDKVIALEKQVAGLIEGIKLARQMYLDENWDGETDCVTPFDQYLYG